jgi:hypothetical protein
LLNVADSSSLENQINEKDLQIAALKKSLKENTELLETMISSEESFVKRVEKYEKGFYK